MIKNILFTGCILILFGFRGLLIFRKGPISRVLSLELCRLGINIVLAFITLRVGQVEVFRLIILILSISAVEAALILSLILILSRYKDNAFTF